MSNILFITEGINDEPNFIKTMFNICYKDKKYEIYSYETTIHTLVSKILKNGKFDEDLDIRLTLKEDETDEEKRKILSKKYKDIFLVFDFEPQHDNTKFNEVKKLLKIFNDSSGVGKLYINYPMMQSYKHLKAMPDEKFKTRRVSLQELKEHKYKGKVSSESSYNVLSKYNYPILMSIVIHHMKKINYILNNTYKIPELEEFYDFDLLKLYNIQLKMLKNKNEIYVVNTFILNIIEHKPKILLEQIKSHKEKFFV